MSLGEEVLKRRTELGWTIYRLSLVSGLSPSTLVSIERGETRSPTRKTLGALESALGISFGASAPEKKAGGPTWKKRDYKPRFALCRKATGRTQAQAAAALRVNKSTLQNWETCETSPPVWSLINMARLYGVTVGYLVGYDDKPYTGLRCAIDGPCPAGKPIDYCCRDCPSGKTCKDRCENSPDRCRLVRKIRPFEELEDMA